jgi:hypothetical protein
MWKTSKGIRNNFHQNLILKLKLVYQPNRTNNSANSDVKLLHGGVGEARHLRYDYCPIRLGCWPRGTKVPARPIYA